MRAARCGVRTTSAKEREQDSTAVHRNHPLSSDGPCTATFHTQEVIQGSRRVEVTVLAVREKEVKD